MKNKRGQNYQPNLQLTSENVDSWIFFIFICENQVPGSKQKTYC